MTSPTDDRAAAGPTPVIRTVLGDIHPTELGVTLPHEHVLIDISCRRPPLGVGSDASDDNFRRGSEIEAADELHLFRTAGGRSIVDVTSTGIGRDLGALARVAVSTGVTIIGGTGWYAHVSHDDAVHRLTAEAMASAMIDDIVDGNVDGVRAGIIGEVGVDGPEPCELRTVRAAAWASSATGAAVSLHVLSGAVPEARESTITTVDLFVEEGGDPTRLIVCHQDGSGDDHHYQDDLLARGVMIEYDTFGRETSFRYRGIDRQLPTDARRVDEVASLIERGHRDRILVSQDVCYRESTRAAGGTGFAHLLTAMPPRFQSAGIGPSDVAAIMITNPARVLTMHR